MLLLLALVAAMVLPPQVALASPSTAFTSAEQAVFGQYGLSSQQSDWLVIDSHLSYEQAIGDAVVPPAARELHAKMKPYLRVVPVLYWGFEAQPRVHLGQIVVHRDLVNDTNQLFIRMFALRFPIQSVIPESQFGYDDERSMLANNSSNYRPEEDSEHLKASAFDINTFVNPFDVLHDDGTRTIDPPGAHYDPTAKGAIVKEGPVRKLWTSLHYEWGGGWGDPFADPPTDFFKVGFFDYQHFQLDYTRFGSLPLPPGI